MPTASPRSPREVDTAAAVLCGVQFVDVLGVTVVVTALPQMLADLGAGAAEGSLVVTAYAMFFGGLLMLASRVGDRVGHRRLVLAGLVAFGAASALAAAAPSVWLLALARAFQGVAAAASVPSALRLLTTVVPEGPRRSRAVAWWSAAGATAGASGFVVGGVLTELASWRTVFWLNIVLAVLLSVAVLRVVPADTSVDRSTRVGWWPAALLTGAAMGLVAGPSLLGESEGGAAVVPPGVAAGATAAGVLAGVAFVLVERRARHPLGAPGAWDSPGLRWGALGSFANTAATSSSVTVATLHLQGELGLSALQAAAVLVTVSVLAVVGSSMAPAVVRRLGWSGALAAGLAVVAGGNGLLVAWSSVGGTAVASGALGLGIGVASVAANDLGTRVRESLRATAAGLLNTAAQLGTAVGTAVAVLVAGLVDPRAAWAMAAGTAAAASVAALVRAPRGPLDASAAAGDPAPVDRSSS